MSNPILQQFKGLTLGQVITTPFVSVFTSTIVGGQHVFSGLVQFHKANAGTFYYLDDIEVSSNIDTLVFADAMTAPMALNIFHGAQRFKLNQSTIPVIGHGNIPLQMFYKIGTLDSAKKRVVNLSLDGALNITAALAARASVSIFVRGVLYQTTSADWLKTQVGG